MNAITCSVLTTFPVVAMCVLQAPVALSTLGPIGLGCFESARNFTSKKIAANLHPKITTNPFQPKMSRFRDNSIRAGGSGS